MENRIRCWFEETVRKPVAVSTVRRPDPCGLERGPSHRTEAVHDPLDTTERSRTEWLLLVLD